jgi:hypothetical protein
MTYKTSHLFLRAETPDGRKIWDYSSTDSFGTVSGSNYFSDALTKEMAVGDLVNVWRFSTELPNNLFSGFSSFNFATVSSVGSSGGTVVDASGVSPGGSSGQLQYNNSGAFGGAAALTYAASGTNLTVTAQNATDVPFKINGAGSQSGNLLELRNSSNTLLSKFDSAGNLVAPTAALGVGATIGSNALVIVGTPAVNIQAASGSDGTIATFNKQDGSQFGYITSGFGGVLSIGIVNVTSAFQLVTNAATINFGSSADTILARDSANIIAQVNSTNANSFRVYNTSSSSNANYERGFLDWNGTANLFRVGTDNAGTGVARNMALVVGGSTTVTLSASAVNLASGVGLQINSNTLLAGQATGYGTPTGGSHQSSFSAAGITLANLAACVAQLIVDLKAGNMPAS